MPTIQDITDEILRHEGGYVNDPDDPGGATNHGVTIHTMRRLGLDLDGDGRVTVADVKRLTRAQAAEIFIEYYFKQPRIDRLPEALHATVYDMYVNAGSNAVKLLQSLFRNMGFDLARDGVIGPQTIRVAHEAYRIAKGYLVDAYGISRRNYYYSLADRRPASRKYARRRNGGKGGWITRAETFIAPRYHFSAAQHRERTKRWG